MAAQFDPYHKWLGILPKDLPANHYRLLGLEPFEDDLQVIEAAADRQLTFLRKYQSGEHASDCMKLLNEVTRARICLLKNEAKLAYDQQLRTQLSGSQGAIDFGIHEAGSPVSLNAGKRQGILILAGVGGILAVVACALFISGGRGKANPDANLANAARSNPTKSTAPSDPTQNVSNKPPRKLDLLAQLTSEHILKGRWKIEKDRLESLSVFEPEAQVVLPVDAPAEYTLHIVGTRLADPAPLCTFGVGLVCGQYAGMFAMETTPPNGVSGIQQIDDRNWDNNSTTLRTPLTRVGTPFELDVIVRHNNIEVRIDGKTIVDWQGEFYRLRRHPHWNIAGSGKLFLSAESQYVFTKLELGPPLPRRKLPGEDLKPGETVELLNLVDIKTDVWNGDWLKEGRTMKSAATSAVARFAPLYQVPEEYELVAEVRNEVPGRDFYLGLPFQAGHVGLGIGGQDAETNVLVIDQGAQYNEPGVFRRAQLFTTERNKIVATVRKNHVVIAVNDVPLFDWQGDPRRHVVWPNWATPGNRLTVGTNNFAYSINSLKLTRLTPSENSFSIPPVPRDGDLLAIVDPVRDTTQGVWKRTPNGLQSTIPQYAGIRFPAKLPVNYEFRFVVERKVNGDTFQVTLPVAGRPVMLTLDGWSGTISGIEMVENRRANENSTTIRQSAPCLPFGKPVVLQGRVEGPHLTVNLNDQKLWDLDVPEMPPPETWGMRVGWMTAAERLQMYVSTWFSEFEIREARFRPLDSNSPAFPPIDVATAARPTTEQSPDSGSPAPAMANRAAPGNSDRPLVGDGLLTTGTDPVPDSAAMESVEKKIREVYADDFANLKKEATKLALSEKLEKLANEPGSDPATKYFCLDMARKLASEAADINKSLALVDSLGLEFKLDALNLKAATLTEMAPRLKGPQLNRDLVDKSLSLVDQLIQAEKYRAAVDLASMAAQAAVKVKDKAVQSDVADSRKEADEWAREFAIVEQAREKLQSTPDDAASSLVWGRWLCLRKNNWSEGLKALQHSDDAQLKDLAARDLQEPTAQEATRKLGTDWLEFAKSRKDHTQAGFADRALFWLEKAENQSSGLTKKQIETLRSEAVSVRDWNSPVIGLLDQLAKKVIQRKFGPLEETKYNEGDPFQDLPPEGGILIGFHCFVSNWFQFTVIKGLQPIYATKLGTKTGSWYGHPHGHQVTILARPGYAVNGMYSQFGAAFDNLQVSFVRITRVGLDPKRGYLSPIVGSERAPRGTKISTSGGQPIVGVYGHSNDFLRSLGLIAIK